jgi:hypothetical protein
MMSFCLVVKVATPHTSLCFTLPLSTTMSVLTLASTTYLHLIYYCNLLPLHLHLQLYLPLNLHLHLPVPVNTNTRLHVLTPTHTCTYTYTHIPTHRLLAVAGATVSSIAVYDTQKLVAVYRGGRVQTLNVTLTRPPLIPPNYTGTTGVTGSDWPETPQKDVTLGGSLLGASSPYSPLTPAAIGTMGPGEGTGVIGRGMTSSTPGNDVSAPVTGIAFSEDVPGGFLLVTTDRHIISLPLDPGPSPDEGEDGVRRKVSRFFYNLDTSSGIVHSVLTSAALCRALSYPLIFLLCWMDNIILE